MARSKELVPGVGRLSRSQVFAKRGLFKGPKKSEKPAAEPTPEFVEKTVGGEKNGGKRLVPTQKAPRFYPAEDVRQPKKSRKSPKPTALRSTITPGTVLILLAGRYRGKRVVFLKQLASGLLLVTGPYKVNGVPLRRVNQAYVIATSTKLDLGDLKVRNKLLFFMPQFPYLCLYRTGRREDHRRLLRKSLSTPQRLRSPSSPATRPCTRRPSCPPIGWWPGQMDDARSCARLLNVHDPSLHRLLILLPRNDPPRDVLEHVPDALACLRGREEQLGISLRGRAHAHV